MAYQGVPRAMVGCNAFAGGFDSTSVDWRFWSIQKYRHDDIGMRFAGHPGQRPHIGRHVMTFEWLWKTVLKLPLIGR